MPPTDPAATVVVPSRGLRERGALLRRAVESIRGQRGVRAVPLVVLNGAHRAPEVESALRALPGVRVLVRDEGGLAAALRAGREAVETPFFGTLDDDDLLLPDALAQRIEALRAQPAAAVVVTNGVRRRESADVVHVGSEVNVSADPLAALLRLNWLLPGSWLAHSARVGVSLFDGMPLYRECTFLAFRFSLDYPMVWLQEPTMVYSEGSPFAESKSTEYLVGQVDAVRALLALPLPTHARQRLRREVADSYHEGADTLWRLGRLSESWHMHLRSLRAKWGVRYLPFTRHLLASTLAAMLGRGPAPAAQGAE
jgi:hypothetical protein